MINVGKKRLGRTMMFLNIQKPGLIKGPYIYGSGSVVLDLEDAMAKSQKDVTRLSLYHALKTIDYRGRKKMVYINGLGTSYWKEDTRCTVAGGCDAIRTLKTERPEGAGAVEGRIGAAEREFGVSGSHTLIMAAIEPVRGVMKALDICEASKRFFGITLSDGDYIKDLQTHITGTGIELMNARQNMIIAARAAGVQYFSTAYTNLDDVEGFHRGVGTIHPMGFDGKSTVNPRQITIIHEIFTPIPRGIIFAEEAVKEIDDKRVRGVGVFTVDGEMIDIAFYDGARRIITPAKIPGVYKGGL